MPNFFFWIFNILTLFLYFFVKNVVILLMSTGSVIYKFNAFCVILKNLISVLHFKILQLSLYPSKLTSTLI